MTLRRLATLLLVIGLTAVLAVACDTGALDSPSVVASLDAGVDASPTDDTSTDVEDPPTLAPVPSGVKAGAKCDAAFKAWVDWWVAATNTDDTTDPSSDPAAASSDLLAGDPDKLDHTLFDSCTLAELGAANADHPVTLDSAEPPAPYIDEEIGSYVAGLCDEEPDVIGDTKLCAPYASPSP
jgi:hypothetical protein